MGLCMERCSRQKLRDEKYELYQLWGQSTCSLENPEDSRGICSESNDDGVCVAALQMYSGSMHNQKLLNGHRWDDAGTKQMWGYKSLDILSVKCCVNRWLCEVLRPRTSVVSWHE
ncbi:hypothetical protein Hanom_Chr10g00918171 [Helianthus anomalus]